MFILILFQKSYINPVMKYKAMYQVLIVEDDKTNRLFYEKLKVGKKKDLSLQIRQFMDRLLILCRLED